MRVLSAFHATTVSVPAHNGFVSDLAFSADFMEPGPALCVPVWAKKLRVWKQILVGTTWIYIAVT